MNQELLYELRDGIGIVTFNRPDARNALTFGMYEGLAEICEAAADKGEARALVLRGAGEEAFAAGTDIAQFRAFKTAEDALGYEQRIDKVLGAVERCPLPTVAALLTIVGYSLNDTIVVFDRIRENLGKKGGRREDPFHLVNRSINETLPRTILTSGTTIAVLMALLVLGGAVIRDFTMVLILGILIGTYSSIFVASPALLEIQKRWGTGDEKKRKRKRPAEAAAAL